MIQPGYVRLLARYGEWQNGCLIRAASQISNEQRQADAGLFFGSIAATLNHLLWGDQLWLSRLGDATPPAPQSIPESVDLCSDWASYCRAREATDVQIRRWSESCTEVDLSGSLTFHSNSRGGHVTREKWAMVVQMFNHGTHHRGQVHGALTRLGIATEATDIQYMPE